MGILCRINPFFYLANVDIALFSLIAIVISLVVYLVVRYVIVKNNSKIVYIIFFLFSMLFLMNYRLSYAGYNTLLVSLFETLKVFFFNGDLSNAVALAGGNRLSLYFWSALYVLAPIMTITAIISIFVDFVKLGKIHYYRLFGFKDVYVFSELNEESITLAKNIAKNRKSRIYFCDVFEANTENYYELKEDANEINATCLKQDISTVNFKKMLLSRKFSKVYYFVLSNDQTENFNQVVSLIEGYDEVSSKKLMEADACDNIYVFGSNTSYQRLYSECTNRNVNVRVRNLAESFLFSYIRENVDKILKTARNEEFYYNDNTVNVKVVDVLILGLGSYGREMLKLLTWICQTDGYGIRVNVVDADANAQSKFEFMCPALMDDEYNKFLNGIGSNYSIKIHSGIDVFSSDFRDLLGEIYAKSNPTYILASLGDDEINLDAGVMVDRVLYQRNPEKYSEIKKIDAVVHNHKTVKIYEKDIICCIGDNDKIYSLDNIVSYSAEADGRNNHIGRGYSEKDFWEDAYSYRSSIAEPFFMKARESVVDFGCVKVRPYSKSNDDYKIINLSNGYKKEKEIYITDENYNALKDITDANELELAYYKIIERNRWNTYMLTEGFVYNTEDKNNPKRVHWLIHPFRSIEEINGEQNPYFYQKMNKCEKQK